MLTSTPAGLDPRSFLKITNELQEQTPSRVNQLVDPKGKDKLHLQNSLLGNQIKTTTKRLQKLKENIQTILSKNMRTFYSNIYSLLKYTTLNRKKNFTQLDIGF